ncbi:OmpH family outer membrane protein [Hyunsoonleella sp. SJ7]|uniref:OmpH family outer membrane protein n=1 Tax=Hyunsoonleella aquatilis TaxID=2762758 RepID=A0A923HEV8_9FLAO|nr:OmpH family outer membrane protein [Hyunsoonleella aquatilis]MBC3759896.1 OmpH family outer membrane protein [Hyunsoonleella aquatilis]
MKHIFYTGLLLLVLASCQKPNKIGYIDNSVVINEYQEKKDIEARFKGKEQLFTKRFDSIEEAFQFEVQKFQVRASKMSQKKAQERYEELGKLKQINDQQKQSEAQALTLAFQTEIDTLIVKVKDFVKDYGKQNGYTYILGTSDAAASVLYGTDDNDLTQTILEALNASYKDK